MSAIGILTYLFGVIFLVSALAFAYYALRNTRLMRGAPGHRLMAAGSVTSIVAFSVNTTEFLLFPRPIMALPVLGVWILAILFIVFGGILRAEDIRRVLKISWIKSISMLAPAKYYLIGIPVLLFCNIPLKVLSLFYGYFGVASISWIDAAGACTLAIAFVNLVAGERRFYLTAQPSAAVASGKETGLVRSDMLAVKCCEVLTNTFLARVGPAVSNGLIRKTLADYFEYNPILFEGCRLKEDGSIDVAPMMVNLNRISRGNRVQTVCTLFATLNSKVMNLYGAVTSPELARKTLEDSYVAVKEQYGDIPVLFDILRTMPKGVLENEKLALLSKVELEAKVEERTRELKEAYKELAEAKEYLDSIIKSMSDILIVVDPEGKMKTINRVTGEILGYEEDELIGQPVNKIFAPAADSLFRDGGLGRLIREGSVQSYEIGVKTKDGRIIPFDVNTSAIMEGGKLKAVQIVARDITERKKAEELYMTVAKSSQVGIYIVQDGKFQFVNPQFQRYTGFSQDELLGMDSLSIVHPEDRQMVREDAIKMLRGQRSSAYKFRSISKDGQTRWIMETVTPIQYRGNRATLGNYMDITELKEAEELYETLVNSPQVGVFVVQDGKLQFLNPYTQQYSGFSQDELLRMDPLDFVHPEDREMVRENTIKMLKGERYSPYEFRSINKSGQTRWVAQTVTPIQYKGKRAVLGNHIDITERKETEERLLRLSSAVKMSRDSIVISDLEGKIIDANEASLQMYGADNSEELIGKNSLDLIATEDRERAFAGMEEVMEKGYVQGREYYVITKDDSRLPVEMNVAIMKDMGGRAVGFVAMSRDITERKKAEQALKQTRDYLENLINYANAPIIVWNPEFKVTQFNHALERLIGYTADEVIGQELSMLFPEASCDESLKKITRTLSGEYWESVEIPILRKDGDTRLALWNSANIYAEDNRTLLATIAQGQDITERKKAEQALKEYSEKLEDMVQERTRELREAQEQLVRKERLAVLGQLAGGVGHELRNPLGVISNAVYLLHIILPNADERAREYLDIISSEVDNAEKIVSDLLDFSRTRHPEREKIAISDLMAQVLEKQAPPDGVKVSTNIAPDLPLVFVDPRQIGQVLGNLVTNACEAMPDGGKLTISAQIKEGMVHLSVSDTGCGISKENMKRMFEPLFTTKVKGIGLGLSMSKNLVEANGGSIKIESKEGKGTTFTVRLPLGG